MKRAMRLRAKAASQQRFACRLLIWATLFSGKRHQECDDRHDQKDDEEHFCDSRRARRDSAKTEKRGDQGYDEKYHGVVEHGLVLQTGSRLRAELCSQCS